jgi:hypothetical protein
MRHDTTSRDVRFCLGVEAGCHGWVFGLKFRHRVNIRVGHENSPSDMVGSTVSGGRQQKKRQMLVNHATV